MVIAGKIVDTVGPLLFFLTIKGTRADHGVEARNQPNGKRW